MVNRERERRLSHEGDVPNPEIEAQEIDSNHNESNTNDQGVENSAMTTAPTHIAQHAGTDVTVDIEYNELDNGVAATKKSETDRTNKELESVVDILTDEVDNVVVSEFPPVTQKSHRSSNTVSQRAHTGILKQFKRARPK